LVPHLKGAALGATGIVIDGQDLIGRYGNDVRHLDRGRNDAALAVLNRHYAVNAISVLDRRLQRAAAPAKPAGQRAPT
jgi:hypothetical protein